MGVSTSAGTTISIGTTAAIVATDTFTEIGEVTTIPEFGRVYSEIKFSPLSSRGTQKFKGSFDDGNLAIQMGKDLSDAGQAAALVARDSDLDYNFKITANDAVAPASATGVSITAASPGLVTDTAHGLAANTPVKFTAGSGTLPTGIVEGTTYYVKSPLINSYNLSATPGGTAIVTTGSPSGTYTRTTVPAPTTLTFKAKVMSFTTKFDNLDSTVSSTMSLSIQSGSITETAKIPLS